VCRLNVRNTPRIQCYVVEVLAAMSCKVSTSLILIIKLKLCFMVTVLRTIKIGHEILLIYAFC